MAKRIIGKTKLEQFKRDEDGSMTVFGIFLTVAILITAGLAVDVNNAIQSEVQLQGAADAAGHAGMVELYKNGTTNVATKAIAIAELNMPTSVYGNVLVSADVQIGSWNDTTRTFTAGASSGAVMVTTKRESSRSNPLATFLFRLVGFDSFDLNASSVWAVGGGFCPGGATDGSGEGFFSLGEVDMQSSNTFNDGFCIHGESGVKVSNGNDVTDAYVTMADFYSLQGPSGNKATTEEDYAGVYANNPGLETAHGTYSYYDALTSYFSNATTEMNALYDNPAANTSSPLIPSSFTVDTSLGPSSDGVVYHELKKDGSFDDEISMSTLTKGAINHITCSMKNGNTSLTIKDNEEISGVVIVTNCDLAFGSGSAFSNGSFITTSTSKNNSISGPSGSRFGSSGYCPGSSGGTGNGQETVVMTAGDVTFASGFQSVGMNMVVLGEVHNIAANADGSGGINLMSQGDVDITTGGSWGFCGQEPDALFSEGVFRMVG